MKIDAKPRILVVEDEPTLVDTLEYNLTRQDYTVSTATDGFTALEKARTERPDLIVLDVMLPGLDGFEICRILRQEMSTPILMLTARDDEIDKVVGLEVGADEYVTKPFSMRELQARIKAMLRLVSRFKNTKVAEPDRIEIGELVIDLKRHEVFLDTKKVNLTLKEFELLKLLALNANKVLSREYLIEQVWGYDFTGEGRTVDVHIHWLREKIESDPENPARIQTVRGVGYRFERRVGKQAD